MMTTRTTKARTEFSSAINQICSERGIKLEVVLDSIKQAILTAYRKDAGKTEEDVAEYSVTLNPTNGEARVLDDRGNDITSAGFGRIAAQNAKQVILQRVREAEKDAIIKEFEGRLRTITNGVILRFEGKTVIMDIGRTQAIMPPEEQSDEHYRLNQRLVVYVKEIRDTPRGQKVVVSRADPQLVAELFAKEVPEVANRSVSIKTIARDPGKRTKIAVDSTEDGIDPVGSCVGKSGVRVQAVIGQLGEEKIDIIEYYESPVEFIRAALAPAEGLVITLDEKRRVATVVAPPDQQAIAIGRNGQNVNLASQLTNWELNIVSLPTPVAQDSESPIAPSPVSVPVPIEGTIPSS